MLGAAGMKHCLSKAHRFSAAGVPERNPHPISACCVSPVGGHCPRSYVGAASGAGHAIYVEKCCAGSSGLIGAGLGVPATLGDGAVLARALLLLKLLRLLRLRRLLSILQSACVESSSASAATTALSRARALR